MVSLERKFDILHHSISSFTRWLESCSRLLESLSSSRTVLEASQRDGEGSRGEKPSGSKRGTVKATESLLGETSESSKEEEEAKLRELALQYKDMLLQIKEQCNYMQQINSLCKEIRSESKDERQMQRQAKASETVSVLSRRFTVTCATAKQQYSQLSSLLQSSSGAKMSPGMLRITTPSFSPTPTLTHRVARTPPPSLPPRPSSAQAHRPTLTGNTPSVFVRPTTFSLVDREKEQGGYTASGDDTPSSELKLEGKLHNDGRNETKGNGPKAPTSDQQKSAKSIESKPKETSSRSKGGKKLSKKRQSGSTDQNDPTPEILSLEGSPVIPGRRIFKAPSQESLEGIGDGGSPDMGQTFDGQGSPVLPVFRGGLPDLWMEHPRSSTPSAQSGNRVKVLPMPEPAQVEKVKPQPPPALKPKPTVPKKPPSSKLKTSREHKQQQQNCESSEGEKNRPKKTSRFPKLPGFGGTNDTPKLFGKSRKDSGKKEKTGEGVGERGGGGGKEIGTKRAKGGRKTKDDGRQSPKLFAGDHEEEEPEDGRESPLLQGRRGVKVMLTDNSEKIVTPHVAESAKRKTTPPPVARKPVGLMERITTEKKTSNQSAKTPPTYRGTTSQPITPGSPQRQETDTKPVGNIETEEFAAGPSQNRPPQLRVHIYKLEHLAGTSVPSASNTQSKSEGTALASGLLPNETTLSAELRGLRERLTSNSRDSGGCNSQSNTVELQGQIGLTTPGSGREVHEGWRLNQQDLPQTAAVGRIDKPETTDTFKKYPNSHEAVNPAPTTSMEAKPGYDRLGLGNDGLRGSGKYDRLVSKDESRQARKVKVYGALSELEGSMESGSGQDEAVNPRDEGGSYFIGGQGRESISSVGRADREGRRDRDTSPEESLKGRLRDLSSQLQQYIQTIADREKSNLQSLELEIHMGEVKAMLTLLEVRDFELAQLRANFSPTAKQKLASLSNPPAHQWPKFSPEDIQKNREEIVKLSERIALLEQHCRDSINQIEEVMEFVLLFEKDLKILNQFLSVSKERLQLSREMGGQHSEEAWKILTETLADVNGQRTKLSSVEQLSNHLLYLEPIFDGDSVRGDMQHLSTEYQGIILEIFSQLEALAHVKCEHLLMDMSVLSSWATEAGLAVQALAKRSKQSSGTGDRIAASKESLDMELKHHKSTLLAVTKELEKITALLSPDDHDSLRELVFHVSQASKSLVQIEKALSSMEFGSKVPKVKGNGAKSGDRDYIEMTELEDSLTMLVRKHSRVLPPVPVRNVNGAKANVKESDYSRIEDLEIHRHTPTMQDKPKRLVPYAEVSTKVPVNDNSSAPPRCSEADVPPPPVPKRTEQSSDGEKSTQSRCTEISAGQSIRDFPLPPRPNENGGKDNHDWGRSTSLFPPPPGARQYNSLPNRNRATREAGMDYHLSRESATRYDVPQSLRRGEVYDVPKSLLQQHQVLSQGRSDDIYDVPRSQERAASQDLYDVPRSLLGSSYDMYDVPRSLPREGQAVYRKAGPNDLEHVMLSPDDSTSPPVYDVPRALRQGHSGQGESGQGDSGQEDGGVTYKREVSPELMYDVPRMLLEPPSPLVEFNQFTTRQLDRAIHRLPHSALYRPDLEVIGVGLNTSGAEFRPTSLHEELLQFIMEEWSQIPAEASPQPSNGSRRLIEETARLLDDHTHTEACLSFNQQVGELEENVKGIVARISNLRVPKEPDLEKVHNGIDQCESLFAQLKKLQPLLSSCNESSLTLLATLSISPPPTLLSSHPPPPSVRLAQLIEIWLFDLTTALQNANVQLATKLRELRERESLTNTLHRQLQTLSHSLSAAGRLVAERDEVIEVRGYLQQCKEMLKQLSGQSVWIDQLVAEIQDYVTTNPQSHVCQELLEQIQQVESEWTKTCQELAAVPQLEPTLREQMLLNVAKAIGAMENDLPGLEVTGLKLDEIIEKQRKARSLVSKSRQLLSSLQTAEVNLQQTLSPPAGNQGNHVVQEVVGGVDHAQQQRQCRELQQECRKIMSELKTLSSLLATSHTLLDRLTNETQDLQVWIDDTKTILELGEKAGTQQHRVKFQAISQQLIAKQRRMESYQSLVSEVLLLPGDEKEKKGIEKKVLALYADWDVICQQCIPAGTLPLMSPTTPQGKCFQAPTEFEDPLQMVEWLILLESKLQPEKLVVGDYLHVRRALRDVQLIEAEMKSKEKVYDHFMKGVDSEPKTLPDTETESEFNGDQREDSASPEPLLSPVVAALEFNPPQGVKFNDEKVMERRKRRNEMRNAVAGMESVQEQSGEEDEGNGTETPHVAEEPEDDSTISTPRNSLHGDAATERKQQSGGFDWAHRRYHSVDHTSLPKQPSIPLPIPPPPSSLHQTSTQSSLLSSLSSLDLGSRSLLSRQVSLTSSVTTSLAELLEMGSPTASMPDDLYQLMLLWNGIKMAIGQKRQRLEQIRDLWKSFEEKKEEFVNFLTLAEKRLREFPETLGRTMDISVIQNEIETQKSFLEEIPDYELKFAVLKELGHNLATRYHAEDSTTDLQDVLKDINERWTTVMDSVSRHQPEVNLLSQQWAEFHTHYQSFHQWLRNMDTEMANLNPFISNMATVQMQLWKLKEIQEELTAHEGVMDSIKLLSYKLQQEDSHCHINPAAIHSRMENVSRRWDHLLKLAQERHLALEESLTDKQQLLTRMADCLSWLQQAEQHLANQKPLGGDYYQIHDQYLAHKTFSQEVQEQVPKVEAVVQAGRSGLLEVQWPVGTPERSRMDSLRSEFSVVERRWVKLKADSDGWGKILDSLNPEMETFQTLCAECGQRLSEVELRASGMPPVANRIVMLTQQLEELREFESGLVVVGNVLEKVISTQKKLVQLGAKVSSDLAELVKRFHERWVEVKKKVTARYSSIDKAMVKYDPENLGVATLPKGWIREKTKNGTPYYVENTLTASRQWQHPDLSQLYKSLEQQHNQPCYPNLAYPAALKLRALQKKTQLHLLETRIAMQTFEEDHIYNIYNSDKSLSSSDMIMLCLGLFEQAERHPAVKTEPLYVNRAVELTAAWIRDVYDITHEGSVTCVSFQIAMVSLSHGRLEDKQRGLFKLIAKDSESITLHQLADFLEHIVQIPQNLLEVQYCSLDTLDYYAQECFKKFADESGQLGFSQFLSWIQTEPLPLAWLAVMHRIMASENTQHDVRCAVCKGGPPISGFRYRCQQCHNYDMCQTCFWSGGTTHGHDHTKHYVEEYCIVRPSGDELKDFFRNLQRHMKRKKKLHASAAEVLQEHAPHIIGDHVPTKHPPGKVEDARRSPAAKQRHAAVSVGDSEYQPYRRCTSPPPQAQATTTDLPPKPAHHVSAMGTGDIDSSLCKISEENKNLSQTLNTLRRHRDTLSSDPVSTPTLGMQNGEPPMISAANKPPQPKAAALQGRVKVLEEHNTKLEGYISQLKKVTEMQPPQLPRSDYPVGKRPNEGNLHNHTQLGPNKSLLHQRTSNGTAGGSAHLTPRGSHYAKRPERKYHYITLATGSPSHQTPSPSPSHSAANPHQATMATGSPSHFQHVPKASPVHQRMVLRPPALEIQEELTAHEGVMDSIKLLSYKLQQEDSHCHINPAAIHSRMENVSRRWDHLLKLAQERHLALEESLTDKQQLLTRMADCLSWLQQAEQHLANQKPLGGDYYQVHDQYLAHKTFSQEVQEQVPKMEAVVQAGRSGLLEVQWPVGTPERSRMDSLRSEFSVVERRWVKLKADSDEWGKILDSLNPEMETFQTLCAECGQRLSEVELRASGMPPVANRIVMLTQQLEELREFESGLVVVGNVLEKVISTQKKLVQLGAKVSSDLAELVKRFHERWVEVKKKVTARYSSIDKAMVKYDPENLGVATLPKGWIREKTKNGTPYYVENTLTASRQWQHPDLSQLYKSLEQQHHQPCYPNLAYPAALKLRALQKKTQLHLLETRIAMQTFEEDHIYNIYNSDKSLSSSDMIMLCLGLFEQAECHPAVKTEPLYVNRAVELTAAWIRDVYDITHEGSVTCVSFQIAMVSLSHGRLEDKQRGLFKLIAKDSESITLHQLADFLEHIVQIPQNLLEVQYCSLDTLDYYAQECFKKFADESGQLGFSQFLSWIQTEPLPLAWLAVMHRIMASENTQHDVRCAVCKGGPPISGFRYRCQQCHNYDMCQTCFWSGGTTHGHDHTKHYVEEYCIVRPSGDELKDFFRNLQRHMKRKKKLHASAAEVLQEHAPHIIGDHVPTKHPPGKVEDTRRSPAAKQRHAAFTPVSVGDSEYQPYRRCTSPPPQAQATTTDLPPKPAQQHDGHHVGAMGTGDIDSSLCKISEENKNLSQTLNTLRRHRDTLSSDPVSTPTLGMQNGEPPMISAANKPPQPKAAALQGRVKVLEEHNTKLEGYISQLKKVTEMQPPQLPRSDYPVGKRPNEGNLHNHTQLGPNKSLLHQRTSNGTAGGSAHLTPRGSHYAKRPERKYHYITLATGSPSHQTPSPSPSHSAANPHQATMAMGRPSHFQHVPKASPVHQRMVLRPPALVRNKSHSPATLL